MKITIKNKKEITAPPKFDKVHKKVERENKIEKFNKRGSVFYLIWFLTFVAIFIAVALSARTVFLLQKSTFTTNSYSILVQNKRSYIYAFEKSAPKLSIIKLPDSSGSRIKKSLSYSIPIDSSVETNSNEIFSSPNIFRVIFKPWNFSYNNMTAIDHMKLVLSFLTIPRGEVNSKEIKLNREGEVTGISQQKIYEIFKDPVIINEGLSLSIINATKIDGLGDKVAQIMKIIGGNVVSVSSAEENKASTITAEKDSVTLKRISNVLGIKANIEENISDISDIADVKIVLGKDFEKRIE